MQRPDAGQSRLLGGAVEAEATAAADDVVSFYAVFRMYAGFFMTHLQRAGHSLIKVAITKLLPITTEQAM